KVVSPVLEAGMIIGVAHIDRQATIKANYSQRIIQTTTRDFGGALIGFYSSVGMSFNVTPVFKINLAMNCTAGSYSPTRWNRTKFTVDGKDQLQALNTASREGTYVKELDFRATQSNSAPSKDIKYSAPFSSIGITVGLCFKFGKKPKKVQKGKQPNVIQPY
ncbi:MAG TPA: hypothetical protein VK154_05205, partial [Chitinophagales bacterium]|nr:hypothetical protein [Chitinophagales bacterium]